VQTDRAKTIDKVTARLTRGRQPEERVRHTGLVVARLFGPDGALKYEEQGRNLVTNYGDEFLATRAYDDTVDIVTGMKLGTGTTAVTKADNIETYITGSNEALDAAATDSDLGAGSGHRVIYVCTWVAGDVTNGAIGEVVLTNQTALADNAGAATDKVARYVFASTIDKQAGDSLEVTWNIDVLGA
jgi:hypothetical protein